MLEGILGGVLGVIRLNVGGYSWSLLISMGGLDGGVSLCYSSKCWRVFLVGFWVLSHVPPGNGYPNRHLGLARF